jgi:DNA-directed RNA polymerase subunit RPC12/RpoP
MGKKEENRHFTCVKCKKHVLPLQNGSYRNHCPFCLVSIHVDNEPGDRQSLCKELMLPHRIVYHGKKGWQIVHQCQTCGHEKANKIATGCIQPDNWDLIIQLSQPS